MNQKYYYIIMTISIPKFNWVCPTFERLPIGAEDKESKGLRLFFLIRDRRNELVMNRRKIILINSHQILPIKWSFPSNDHFHFQHLWSEKRVMRKVDNDKLIICKIPYLELIFIRKPKILRAIKTCELSSESPIVSKYIISLLITQKNIISLGRN